MERFTGTTVRGIRLPIIREGDDLCKMVVDGVIAAQHSEGFDFHDKDVIAITESVVARAEGNYATCDDVASDIRKKFPEGEIGLLFPILSRNRFAIVLRGIARGSKKIVLQLSYPKDEMGNALVDIDKLDDSGIDPMTDVLTEKRFRELFGSYKHPFTGVDYIEYYREVIEKEGCEVEIILANNPLTILQYTQNVLTCDVHSRRRNEKKLKKHATGSVYNLDEVLRSPVNGSGYNPEYGMLGSNKASEEKLKLFPRNSADVVSRVQEMINARTGKHFEVMVYGDGAFKDPVGGIWELADPVVSPAHTTGLAGTPNELKIKFLADNDFASLSGEKLQDALIDAIKHKDTDLKAKMASEGTTPRQLTDLLGSLSDLTSGSGDKGTPVVLIQGYFDNFSM